MIRRRPDRHTEVHPGPAPPHAPHAAPARPPLRRPILALTFSYLLGTGFGFRLSSLHPTWPLIMAASTWAVALFDLVSSHKSAGEHLLRHTARTLALIPIALFSLAWHRAAEWAREQGFAFPASINDGVHLRVIMADDAVAHTGSAEHRKILRHRVRVIAQQDETGCWLPARGTIRLLLSTKRFMPRYGDVVEFHGRLLGADTWRWGNRPTTRPACSVVAVPSRMTIIRGPNGWDRVRRFCYDARDVAVDYLALGIREFTREVNCLLALLFGRYCRVFSRAEWDRFVKSGTLHVFAVSGAHVAILAVIVTSFLRFLRVPRLRWGIAVIPLLVGYTLATGAAASAVRACLMSAAYLCAPMIGRRPDALSALGASALLIVAAAPAQLFDGGFILSFSVVLGLLLLYPVMADAFRRLWAPDPWHIQGETAWKRRIRVAGRYVSDLAAMSLAAWLVSTPLTAWLFQHCSLIAFVSNMVVIPLVSLILLTGTLSLVTGGWAPFVADTFNHANLVLVRVLINAAEWLSRIPGGHFDGVQLSGRGVMLWYAALAFALVSRTLRRRERVAGEPPSENLPRLSLQT